MRYTVLDENRRAALLGLDNGEFQVLSISQLAKLESGVAPKFYVPVKRDSVIPEGRFGSIKTPDDPPRLLPLKQCGSTQGLFAEAAFSQPDQLWYVVIDEHGRT